MNCLFHSFIHLQSPLLLLLLLLLPPPSKTQTNTAIANRFVTQQSFQLVCVSNRSANILHICKFFEKRNQSKQLRSTPLHSLTSLSSFPPLYVEIGTALFTL